MKLSHLKKIIKEQVRQLNNQRLNEIERGGEQCKTDADCPGMDGCVEQINQHGTFHYCFFWDNYRSDGGGMKLDPESSWDCVGGTCVDPGNGNGTFTSLAVCKALCDSSADAAGGQIPIDPHPGGGPTNPIGTGRPNDPTAGGMTKGGKTRSPQIDRMRELANIKQTTEGITACVPVNKECNSQADCVDKDNNRCGDCINPNAPHGEGQGICTTDVYDKFAPRDNQMGRYKR